MSDDLDEMVIVYFSYGDYLFDEGVLYFCLYCVFQLWLIVCYLGFDFVFDLVFIEGFNEYVVLMVEGFCVYGVFLFVIDLFEGVDVEMCLFCIVGFWYD